MNLAKFRPKVKYFIDLVRENGTTIAVNSTKITNFAKFRQRRTFKRMSPIEVYHERGEIDENDEFGEILPVGHVIDLAREKGTTISVI